jgi:acyl-coenzyme A thioesterase PaaI-like protein
VSIEKIRAQAAGALRELGHEFLLSDLNKEQLARIAKHAKELLEELKETPNRVREVHSGALDDYKMTVPNDGRGEKHQLFADSVVSGDSNPMGINAKLWREGEVAFIEATLEKAFEGAPGRAHGGMVAALIDETMGLVMSIQGVVAFTVQLDVSYRAPTPIFRPIVAKAWLDHVERRKLFITCEVRDGDAICAEAKGIFVSVDPTKFLENIVATK